MWCLCVILRAQAVLSDPSTSQLLSTIQADRSLFNKSAEHTPFSSCHAHAAVLVLIVCCGLPALLQVCG